MKRTLIFGLLAWQMLSVAWARPRLETADTEWSGSLKPGGQIGFQVRVLNRSKEVSRGVVCSVFLQSRKLGQVVSNPDLGPNGEVRLEGSVALPSDLAEALQNRNPEQVLQLQVLPYRVADLSPTDIAVEPNSEGLKWIVTLVNKGAAPVPNLPYRLTWDGQPVQQRKILQALGPGESHQFSFVDKRTAETGKHRLAVVVDPDNELEDADPGNNTYQLDWQAGSTRPDLTVREWRMEPENPVVGAPVRILFTLVNSGEIEMYKLPVILKINDKVEFEKKFFQALTPGGEVELSMQWVPAQAGEHKVALVCQGQSSPKRPVLVGGRPGYKLQMSNVSVPKRTRQGKDYVFDVLVQNQGTLETETVKAVLWADGTRVWSARLPNPLAAGQEATLSLRWSANQPGKHQLRFEISGQGPKADEEADVNKIYAVEVEPGEE